MKFIKLFESFGLEPIEILKDIKTISYILEDEGYILSYFYQVKTKEESEFTGKCSMDWLVSSDELENSDVKEEVKFNKIKISIQLEQDENRHYGDNYYYTKLLIDCNKYFGLLKEHLNYISPKKIIAYRSRRRYDITIIL